MRCHLGLGLVGERPAASQTAICQQGQSVALWTDRCLDRHHARFVPIELERREEVHVFDCRDTPAGKQTERSFGKRLDAHYSGQHGCAVNLMIVQKRLKYRVQRGLDGEATLQADACYLADHWPRPRWSSCQ